MTIYLSETDGLVRSECQGQDGGKGKAGLLAQRAQTIAKILKEVHGDTLPRLSLSKLAACEDDLQVEDLAGVSLGRRMRDCSLVGLGVRK